MKTKICLIAALFPIQYLFAQTPSSTTTTPTPVQNQPPKTSSFYGYQYRSFVGVANPGPVNLVGGEMQMHILALRYNIAEKIGVRVGAAYLIHTLNFTMKDMANPSAPLKEETVYVEGFSDLRPSVIYTHYKDSTGSLDFSAGLNLPTSPILKEETGKPLPPQDQFSSGTYDLMLAANYSYNLSDWTFSEKMDGVFHTGQNSAGYRLGDDFGFTTAVSYNAKPWLVPVLSARYTDRKDLAINEYYRPQKANVKYGSGWEGYFVLRSGMPLKADQSLRLGFEAGAPIFKTSRTSQYIVGETLWYVATNLTATY
jgi:hypothetical protein